MERLEKVSLCRDSTALPDYSIINETLVLTTEVYETVEVWGILSIFFEIHDNSGIWIERIKIVYTSIRAWLLDDWCDRHLVIGT